MTKREVDKFTGNAAVKMNNIAQNKHRAATLSVLFTLRNYLHISFCLILCEYTSEKIVTRSNKSLQGKNRLLLLQHLQIPGRRRHRESRPQNWEKTSA